jgi:hypothetical protein
MRRDRKSGYAVAERSAGLADLLYLEVVKLDCGAAPEDRAETVAAIARAMTSRPPHPGA